MDPTLRALNRFGLGARRGERQQIKDGRNWLRGQLDGGAPSLAPPSGVTPAAIGEALRAVRMGGQADEQQRREARRRVVEIANSEVHAALTARVTSVDTYIPLGAAANLVLVQEPDIEAAALQLVDVVRAPEASRSPAAAAAS